MIPAAIPNPTHRYIVLAMRDGRLVESTQCLGASLLDEVVRLSLAHDRASIEWHKSGEAK